MGRLDDRVAIVTGASWGIGAAVAEAFACEGANVVVNTLPDDRMDGYASQVVARITAAGGAAIKVPADISVPADVDTLVAAARDEFGDVDTLVTNAAHSQRAPGPRSRWSSGTAPWRSTFVGRSCAPKLFILECFVGDEAASSRSRV